MRERGQSRILAKCSVCGREFTTDAALAQHMKDKHQAGAEGNTGAPADSRDKSKKKSLRRRNRHPVALALIAIAIVAGIGVYYAAAPAFAPPAVPCSTGESWIHVHPWVRISIENTSVAIPFQIGTLATCPTGLLVLHNHDTSGILHIELSQSDVKADTNITLGDLFRVWNSTGYPTVTINGTSHPVTFSNTDIFGFKTDATHKVVVLVDGKPVANGVKVPLEQLDYCNVSNGSQPPCAQTANSDPLWDGTNNDPYGTGHTIVIEYITT